LPKLRFPARDARGSVLPWLAPGRVHRTIGVQTASGISSGISVREGSFGIVKCAWARAPFSFTVMHHGFEEASRPCHD
jgi:hypothetical protein